LICGRGIVWRARERLLPWLWSCPQIQSQRSVVAPIDGALLGQEAAERLECLRRGSMRVGGTEGSGGGCGRPPLHVRLVRIIFLLRQPLQWRRFRRLGLESHGRPFAHRELRKKLRQVLSCANRWSSR